ncbi:hypothetical protein [Silvimonas amylolytica]|uniref:DUF1579 domain-containing protein n=1 Tax=Silvimonas amylolytica TaxID=449663 RepID=A0ABQ2PN10_9NEIS|nr:hypothetical protein [Silvimonas amylolytica]GGP26755.1 hypothetical protein GCM10010971_25740 [Silvimonas amylolytica]
MAQPFLDALQATGAHPALAGHAETYAWMIGSWTGEVTDFPDEINVLRGPVEMHASWVLQGRAIQDVWIAPAGSAPGQIQAERYGTTLRIFDTAHAQWDVRWFNPVSGAQVSLSGQRVGDQLVQLGMINGRLVRWVFSEITSRQFLWQGFVLGEDGQTWRLQTQFRFERSSSQD